MGFFQVFRNIIYMKKMGFFLRFRKGIYKKLFIFMSGPLFIPGMIPGRRAGISKQIQIKMWLEGHPLFGCDRSPNHIYTI